MQVLSCIEACNRDGQRWTTRCWKKRHILVCWIWLQRQSIICMSMAIEANGKHTLLPLRWNYTVSKLRGPMCSFLWWRLFARVSSWAARQAVIRFVLIVPQFTHTDGSWHISRSQPTEKEQLWMGRFVSAATPQTVSRVRRRLRPFRNKSRRLESRQKDWDFIWVYRVSCTRQRLETLWNRSQR